MISRAQSVPGSGNTGPAFFVLIYSSTPVLYSQATSLAELLAVKVLKLIIKISDESPKNGEHGLGFEQVGIPPYHRNPFR